MWNTASHGTILSKVMNKYDGVFSKVIANTLKNQNSSDDLISIKNPKIRVAYGLLYAKNFDIINIHTIDKLVPLFKKIYPEKKIVMTYHGSEIRSNNYEGRSSIDLSNGKRNQWHLREKYWKYADSIIVSTPDLLYGAPDYVHYIPAPIDRSIWKRNSDYIEKTALYTQNIWGKQGEADKIAYNWAKKNKINLSILDKTKEIIPYQDYPRFLEKFEYYIDVKQDLNGEILESLSSSALQFLSLGGKVFHINRIYRKFPKEADSINVAKKIFNIYLED